MESLQQLRTMLNDDCDVQAVRAAIVRFLRDRLRSQRDTLDAWQAAHYVDAVGALSLNVHAVRQPTTAWLRLCVADLEQAAVPAAERRERAMPDAFLQLDWITNAWLDEAVEAIAEEVGLPHPVVARGEPPAGLAA